MDLKRIAARIAGQTVKSAIESDKEGFTKAIQEIIDYHFMDKGESIKLEKVEVQGEYGWLFLSGGALGGQWEPFDFDTTQEYADFLKELPSIVEGAEEAFLEGPI